MQPPCRQPRRPGAPANAPASGPANVPILIEFTTAPPGSERGLDVEEALVVVERDGIRLLVELDPLRALDAHAPELLLQAEERARLDARSVGEPGRGGVVGH